MYPPDTTDRPTVLATESQRAGHFEDIKLSALNELLKDTAIPLKII